MTPCAREVMVVGYTCRDGLRCVGRGDWWPWDLDPVDGAHWVVIGDDRRSDDTGLRVGCRVWGDANVIQELSHGGAGVLKIARLIKLCMMATLDDAGDKVKVDDVVVRGSVAKEYALEVMTVQFPTPNAHHFNTDTGAKKLQVADVGFMSVENLEWGLLGDGVDEPVV